MANTIVIALREFRQKVTSRAFIVSSLLTPLALVVSTLVAGPSGQVSEQEMAAARQPAATEEEAVGIVDRADLVTEIPPDLPADIFRTYADRQAALAALTGGDIAAFYVIPADYRQTGSLERVSPRIPLAAPRDADWIDQVLTHNLLPSATPERAARLRHPLGAGLTFVDLAAEEGNGGGGMLPFVVTAALMLPLFTSGSYLFQSLSQEKESRIMEILLVSVRPRQLLTGKLIGLTALTLIQYLGWALIGGLLSAATGWNLGQALAGVSLTQTELLLTLGYALGGFCLYAAVMAGVGALAPDAEGSRTWILLVTLPMTIPLYLWTIIVQTPGGALARVLSLIPFSAPIAMVMRMTASGVAAWELAVSLGLLALAVVGVVMLVARLFRAQTLLSGEPLSVRRFLTALRQG